MSRVVTILGGIVATLVAFYYASYKAGGKSAAAEERERDYKEAANMLNRITKPLSSSEAFRNAARAELRRRMR